MTGAPYPEADGMGPRDGLRRLARAIAVTLARVHNAAEESMEEAHHGERPAAEHHSPRD